MVVTICCTCGEWPIPHDHTTPMSRIRLPDGKTVLVPTVVLHGGTGQFGQYEVIEEIPSEIRPSIDWRAFARDIMTGASDE